MSSIDEREGESPPCTAKTFPAMTGEREKRRSCLVPLRQDRGRWGKRRRTGCDGEAVEYVDKGLPDFDVTPPFTLVVESVHWGRGGRGAESARNRLSSHPQGRTGPLTSSNVGTLVITPKHEEVFGVLDLVAQQQEDRFQTLFPAIDVVPQKQIIRTRWEPTHLKQANQVGVLPMDVADDLDGGRQLDQGRLREEDLARSLADGRHFRVLETNRLRDLARVARVEESPNHVVDVERLGCVLVG